MLLTVDLKIDSLFTCYLSLDFHELSNNNNNNNRTMGESFEHHHKQLLIVKVASIKVTMIEGKWHPSRSKIGLHCTVSRNWLFLP